MNTIDWIVIAAASAFLVLYAIGAACSKRSSAKHGGIHGSQSD